MNLIEWQKRPLDERYLTKDGKHLKFVDSVVTHSGDSQYLGSVRFMVVNSENKPTYTTIASNACCNSRNEAFDFCTKAIDIIIDILKNNVDITSTFNLHQKMKKLGYCIYKSRQ